ncbi:MAG: BREX-6 system adenine-specific DNA-methyltransferase PglX, partial [Polyangiaceae bacterium]
NNDRFLRAVWEVPPHEARAATIRAESGRYLPYVKGAEGREWMEPFRWVLRAGRAALELRVLVPNGRVERPAALGVAYTTIGHHFGARLHTAASVRDVAGASVFAGPTVTAEALVCALNRSVVRELASALNPTVNFQLGDVRRLPFDAVEGAGEIVAVLRRAFAEEERGSELSLDYASPRASTWQAARTWAQRAVDRPAGEPLSSPSLRAEEPPAWLRISHALGVALGRFGLDGGLAGSSERGLPDGILLLGPESPALGHPACEALRDSWDAVAGKLGEGGDLGAYLRKGFFAEHRRLYEGRPIHLPLSSAKRTYVAYVSIHRFRPDTLAVLLAEHLLPERRKVEGQLTDIREARQGATSRAATERFTEVQKLLEELNDFVAHVTEIAEKGPPAPDGKTEKREVDARYVFDLDDGVTVNSAALWPLLEPQWKDPKKRWKELANAQGKSECDWSRLAARYFPDRVKKKCHDDPSLAVAHECFWELHPAKAYAWELRLQDEIGPDFTIDEPGSKAARAKFLAEEKRQAEELRAIAMKRRDRKTPKADEERSAGPLFGDREDEQEEAIDE